MARKKRVPYKLTDYNDLVEVPFEEIDIILRAADEIIYTAGRSMLAKILKGSKDKKILENNLQNCPSYGYYKNKTLDEIIKIVDYVIYFNWLEIEYNGSLPMIVFSKRGWEAYKPVYTNELYMKILDANVQGNTDDIINKLKSTNREVVMMLLNKIGESKNIGFIRFLEKWKETEVKKVRLAIDKTIGMIKSL